MGLSLGHVPESLTITLSRGSVFAATLRSQTTGGEPQPWPAGTTLTLELSDGARTLQSWPWTITGADATLVVQAAAVDALPETRAPSGSSVQASLWLDYGQGRLLWCQGLVRWT